MAFRASVVTLAGDPVLLVRGQQAKQHVRLNAGVAVTVGGTSATCTYPVPEFADLTSNDFKVCLTVGDELWADGTGDVNILEYSV